MPDFPSLKARDLERLLRKAPLNYSIARRKGSHRRLTSPTYPSLTLAYHEGVSIPPGMVRKILVKDVGLSEEQAMRVIRGELL